MPFRYESTGAETRFTNQLDPKPRSREVFQFARPETVQTWMHQADADPESPTLRARIADGACLYVCGSLEGMAPGVDAVLREALGDDALARLRDEGRYRRDVY